MLKDKNLDDIIEAVKILDEKTDDFPVYICAAQIESRCLKLRLPNYCHKYNHLLRLSVRSLATNEVFQDNQTGLLCLRFPLKYHMICNLKIVPLLRLPQVFYLPVRQKQLTVCLSVTSI